MNSLVRTLATPLSPVMVSITNHAPAQTSPSGAVDPVTGRYVSPYANADGSLNGAGVALAAVSTVSMALSAYHGLKRNRGSVGYAVLWGLAGGMFPVLTPVIAFGQGFAEPEKK